MPEVYEIAWAAGVFDHGASIKERNRTVYLRINFPFSRDQAVRLQFILGLGKVYMRRFRNRPQQPQYELTGRRNVAQVMAVLYPYLTRPCGYERFLNPERGSSTAASSSVQEARGSSSDQEARSFLREWALP